MRTTAILASAGSTSQWVRPDSENGLRIGPAWRGSAVADAFTGPYRLGMPQTPTKVGLSALLIVAAGVLLYARFHAPALPIGLGDDVRRLPGSDTVNVAGAVETGADSAARPAFRRRSDSLRGKDSAMYKQPRDSLVQLHAGQMFLGGAIAKELLHDKPGQVVLGTDSTMGVGQVSTVVIAVAADTATESVPLTRTAEVSSRTTGSRVGRFMAAELHGAHFNIVPRQKAEQWMYEDVPVTWEFDVMPTESGPQTLTARVARRVKVNGADELHFLPSTSVTVRVAKTINSPVLFLSEHQIGAWGTFWTIAALILGWISGLIDKLRGKEPASKRAARLR